MFKEIVGNKKGYSIFELVIVLTLIAGIIYVIAVGVGNLYNANKDNGRSLAMNSRVPELLSQYYKATNYYPCVNIATFSSDLTALTSNKALFKNVSNTTNADAGGIAKVLNSLNITDATFSNVKKMPNGNEAWAYISDEENCSAYAICAALETATTDSLKAKSNFSLQGDNSDRVLVKTEGEVTAAMKTDIQATCQWKKLRAGTQ